MNMQFKPRLFTVDEFMDLSAKGMFEKDVGGVELHDGRIIQMNAKYLPHVGMQALLVRQIGNLLLAAGQLKCVPEPTIQLDHYNSREPDVAVYAPRADMTKVLYPEAVWLIIEVANDSVSTDLGEKADLYARAGVPDYWVVDLQSQVTHVHGNPSANGYANRSVVRFDEPLSCDALPEALVIAELN
jgi:Uma2 family endonuclease